MSSSNDWVTPISNFLSNLKKQSDESYRKQYGVDPRFSGGNSSAPAKAKSKSSGNIVSIGGIDYAEEDYFGTANKSYRDKAVQEQRTLGRGGKGHDLRGGGGRTSTNSRMAMPGQKPSEPRVPDREEGNGLTTSTTGKSSAAGPMDWKEYENELLNNKGIYLQVDRVGGVGNHPTYEQAVKNAKEYDYGSEAGYGGYETYTGSPDKAQYSPTGQSIALGAQTGTSSDADVGDQSRALRIPKGARQQEVFFRQNPNYGQEIKTTEPQTSAISARSRAFLDAPTGQGVLGVMRHTNAAQNIMRQGDEIVIKTADGEYKNMSQEAYRDVVDNNRNATQFKDEYLRSFVPASPAETQSPDSGNPVPASKTSYVSNFENTVSTEDYGKLVESVKGMNGTNPIAAAFENTMYLDGREPLMRGPKEDEE